MFAASAALFRKLSFHPVDDFTTISMTAELPYVLVTYSDHSIRTMADLIGAARSQTTPLDLRDVRSGVAPRSRHDRCNKILFALQSRPDLADLLLQLGPATRQRGNAGSLRLARRARASR